MMDSHFNALHWEELQTSFNEISIMRGVWIYKLINLHLPLKIESERERGSNLSPYVSIDKQSNWANFFLIYLQWHRRRQNGLFMKNMIVESDIWLQKMEENERS